MCASGTKKDQTMLIFFGGLKITFQDIAVYLPYRSILHGQLADHQFG